MNNDKIYDFYLAGPFFNEKQLMQQDFIEMMFQLGKYNCFSPRKDAGTLPPAPSKKDMLSVFNKDLEAIKSCKVLFANVSYKDTGTSVEIGYALSRDIPIVLYWDKDDNDTDHVNLMIALACGGKVIQNKAQLAHYIYTGELPDDNFEFKVD